MNVECNYSKIVHITLTVAEHRLVKYRKSCTLQLWSVERCTRAVYNCQIWNDCNILCTAPL